MKIATLTAETERLSSVIQTKMDESKQLSLIIIEKDRSLSRISLIEDANAQLSQENSRLSSTVKYLTDETVKKLTDDNALLRSKLSETS